MERLRSIHGTVVGCLTREERLQKGHLKVTMRTMCDTREIALPINSGSLLAILCADDDISLYIQVSSGYSIFCNVLDCRNYI